MSDNRESIETFLYYVEEEILDFRRSLSSFYNKGGSKFSIENPLRKVIENVLIMQFYISREEKNDGG